METIDRYMNAVAQALPERRRDEITQELRATFSIAWNQYGSSRGVSPTVG